MPLLPPLLACEVMRTGAAKDTSDLDELDGGLSGIHDLRCGFDGNRSFVWSWAAVGQ
jgi:hypothetical protein